MDAASIAAEMKANVRNNLLRYIYIINIKTLF
jgi:hypothetical protein